MDTREGVIELTCVNSEESWKVKPLVSSSQLVLVQGPAASITAAVVVDRLHSTW